MENFGNFNKDSLVTELTRGRSYANQLRKELHPTPASCVHLLERVISSYDNALELLNCMVLLRNGEPKSEGSDRDSKGEVHGKNSKKRKTLATWSERLRVCTETGFEGQLDDGYYWRKYGQKVIFGAKHPRAYYRCTHRGSQGCLATKQVQRTDKDTSIFEVIYRGKHTCIQEMRKKTKENVDIKKRRGDKEVSERRSRQRNLTSKPENREMPIKDESLPTVTSSPTPIGYENVETSFFSKLENFVGMSDSPPFLSPDTSESYLLLSPCRFNDIELSDILRSPESELAEINFNPALIDDFPSGELDLLMDQIDFGSCFVDPSDYFK
ncbi:probable WRKY transcription factor 41 [Primulina eburnea]|uniref:probable WRKY transcription factor 41 n=1 Tax=Primulina eburnea TaxID=1245227 RepID=UPI003C6BFCC7